MTPTIQSIIDQTPGENLYHDTLKEVSHDVEQYLESIGADHDTWERYRKMLIPDRVIEFDVEWTNDEGDRQLNKGYRVQHNNAGGPYKGGLRFDPSVSVDVLKFLALEQTFKNALTGLPLGSGKGGSDFDPKGKSEAEIERFARAFMRGLYQYIGPRKDVPAGDIGVGGREIGFMLEEYRQLSGNEIVDALTGKPVHQHGSYGRTEATGYGVVYLTENIFNADHDSVQDKQVVISGSGNVATYAALKVIELGGKVLTLSDRGGYVTRGGGLSGDHIDAIIQHKTNRQPLSTIELEGVEYRKGKVWEVAGDVYMPCATQNELDHSDAVMIIEQGGLMVTEGANMPCTPQAVEVLQKSPIIFVPAKAANAGGVAVSGLEMEQNRIGQQWSFQEVDIRLQDIMQHIHQTIVRYGIQKDGSVNYLQGANVGGYVIVDQAMNQ